MTAQDRLMWFRRIALTGAVLAATVVVLGAWVRLTNAGLGCPDWPGCYGHAFPQADHGAAKAWHEMIHRYVALTLGSIIAILLAWAVVQRRDRDQPVTPVVLLFLVVCMQAALGAFTVTLQLRPLIVTGHLFGGLTTLGLLSWLSINPEQRSLSPAESGLRGVAIAALGVLLCQIFLGGWTSSNYAAVACPDFPTCQRSWWPPMDFKDAFVLWRGVDIDYEGGVLANPARMAIHFTHRLGAAFTGTVLVAFGIATAVLGRSRRLSRAGLLLAAAVVLQIAIGIATVHFGVPLPVATLHNAGAALLVIAMVWLLRALWPSTPLRMVPFKNGIRSR